MNWKGSTLKTDKDKLNALVRIVKNFIIYDEQKDNWARLNAICDMEAFVIKLDKENDKRRTEQV